MAGGGLHSPPGKECCLPGKPGSCLPGRLCSLSGEECYLPGKPGNCLPGRQPSPLVGEQCLPGKTRYCLPGRLHSLPGKECCLLGKPGSCLPGDACLGDCTLCLEKSAFQQENLGIACLSNSTLHWGKNTVCLGSLRGSPRSH